MQNSSHPGKLLAPLSVVALLVATQCVPAWAADDKKSDREARRAQMLEQRLEQEQAQWQTERADLQKKLADAQAALDAAKGQNDKSQAELGRVSRVRASVQQQLDETSKRVADLQAASERERAAQKSDTEAFAAARLQERVALNARIDSQTRALAACTDRNERLVRLGHELLQRYDDKSVVDVMRQKEPLLGIGDVDTFNTVQSYGDKVDAEREPAAPAQAH